MNLDRRDFVKTALTAAAASALTTGRAAAAAMTTSAPVADPASRDFLELRAYRLKPGAPSAPLDTYLEKALLPALHARGVSDVGVFTEMEPKDGATVWVLIRHASLATLVPATATLHDDPAVVAAAGDYFAAATKAQPAIDRVDSWLLLAFAGLPRMEVPALKREGKARIFELRIYESYSETKAVNKVAMFNAGEIGVMQELNLSPVFYGQALVGRDLPHLSYLLCSPDRETHARNWKAFTQHPVWMKLKADPQWADNVSKVTSRFLVPAAFSQL